MLSVIEQVRINKKNTAVISNNQEYTYSQLLHEAEQLAQTLLNGKHDLLEQRVAFMVNPGFNYIKTLWAIWLAGGVAVPLCLTHPLPSLTYVLIDTASSILILEEEYKNILSEFSINNNLTLIVLENLSTAEETVLPDLDHNRMALILYTSGTTNKPKGVVTTHKNIETQISTLVDAWNWSSTDHTLCILPLHHVHGIINVIGCAMWSGAICEFIPSFSAIEIFELFNKGRLNVFMAVPTIYFKLIAYFETLGSSEQQLLFNSMQKFRLMVSGSAALPISVMEKWCQISGHKLLERYGMTELGMAISNPYTGERKAGFVGKPLPGVDVKLVDERYDEVELGQPGEIIVKGNNVFKEYWKNTQATNESFTEDGWFKTGDIAVVEEGYYKIMGRSSVDIIKSGGYKISALEIEEVLREYSSIADCAIVGVPDDEWGELIVAAIVLKDELVNIDVNELSAWIINKIAHYKKPRRYLFVKELPRNAMGKVVKNEVKKLF
jgi:malonyl-CoA/methylmalonyl-CoA synthetase